MRFSADKMKISGPMSDGSYKVEFWTGEYEKDRVAKLFEIAGEHNYGISVKVAGEAEAPAMPTRRESKPNRYAKLSALISRRAKQKNATPEEIAEDLRKFYKVESRKDLSDDQLREAERVLEELLGDRVPDEAYEEDVGS